MGRCALHTTRSLAVSHATSAASTVSISSCCIHGWWSRPRGCVHCGLLSGRWPVLALTARCSAYVGRSDFWMSSYVTKHRMTSSRDLVTNTFLASPVWWWRWWRRRTSGFRVYVAGMTCWMTRASVLQISAVSRSLRRVEGKRRQRHCRALCWQH